MLRGCEFWVRGMHNEPEVPGSRAYNHDELELVVDGPFGGVVACVVDVDGTGAILSEGGRARVSCRSGQKGWAVRAMTSARTSSST